MYGRELDGEVLTLAASGWTYSNVFILTDLETRTLWYPYPEREGLLGIDGEHEGRVLKARFGGQFIPWRDWVQERPGSGFVPVPSR